MRTVFLDRDGVVNKVIYRDGKPASPRSPEEFVIVPYAREALQRIKTLGYLLIVVTNQPEISRGLLNPTALSQMSEQLRKNLPLDDILICPHDDSHGCACRKPRPGLLLEAAQKWKIDLTSSFLIGDNAKDMGAGQAVQCRAILLDRPYNQGIACDCRAADLGSAVRWIISQTNSHELH
jgi:D-glycero-D-manno-heptose 1,7-bisphosphate phosphatase